MTEHNTESSEANLNSCPENFQADICGQGPGKIGCIVQEYSEETGLILKQISPYYCRHLRPKSYYYTCVNPERLEFYKQHER